MMRPVPPPVRRAAGTLLRTLPTGGLLARAPRARGRGLALLWHRVRPDAADTTSAIETVSVELFRRQLEALRELGDVVPLADLERPRPDARPRFALTFDDDDPGHARHALPVLAELDLPATFFLSGRWLHGLGPYWWEMLEARIVDEGFSAVARDLAPGATSAVQIAGHVEGTPAARELAVAARSGAPGDAETATAELQQLRASGMEIAFHTVEHPVMPALDDRAVVRAVTDGRDELAGAAGAPITRIAYPHGRSDVRVRAAVERAGYASGWTTSQRPTHADDDPAARGRWEPGPREPDAVVAGAVVRLLGLRTGEDRNG